MWEHDDVHLSLWVCYGQMDGAMKVDGALDAVGVVGNPCLSGASEMTGIEVWLELGLELGGRGREEIITFKSGKERIILFWDSWERTYSDLNRESSSERCSVVMQ